MRIWGIIRARRTKSQLRERNGETVSEDRKLRTGGKKREHTAPLELVQK